MPIMSTAGLEVIVAFDYFTGNGKAHNVPLLYALRWMGA